MEGYFILIVITTFAVLAIISNITKRKRQPERKLSPPGPKPWPIIGNLNLLGPIPHQSLHLLSLEFGQIMLLHFGKSPVIIASSPEIAEQFLKVHDAVFASRPAIAAGKHISYNYSDVSFAPYGPYWRKARKIFVTEFLNPRNLESLEHIHAEERRNFLSRLRSDTDIKPVQLRDHLSRFTLSLLCRMVMTKKYFEEEEEVVEMEELQEMMKEWFVLTGAFNVGDWIPWLGFLDLQGYVRRMKALRRKMDRFYDYVIDDHLAKRAKTKECGNKDFVDALLQIAEDPNAEVQLTRDCIKALIMNMLLGGTDTSATAIEWAIHELLKQPRTIEKAKAELDSVIGRERWVEENDDFSHLPYLDAIIFETFRLHPLATLLAPHYATEDSSVAGYHISKGTTVFVNAWSLGRNPSSWEAAEEFLPERFLGKKIEMTGGNFALLPFGSGRRRCPGYNLGLKIVRTTLANLLHGFELKLEEGMKPQDVRMEESYGLTTNPKYPLSIVMEPTLPDRLY